MEPQEYTLTGSPYFKKVLEVSTGHITKKDNDFLISKEPIGWLPIVHSYLEGYFVHVFSDPETSKASLQIWEKHFSPEFCRIMLHAHTIGVTYVQFDADGVEYTDLKTFPWDNEEEVA
jgi:hypothetical protein